MLCVPRRICYNMCTQRSPYNWSAQLYQRHNQTFQDYLTRKVLPALRNKHDRFLLRELSQRWERHLLMNKWMKRFFMYLVRGSLSALLAGNVS